MSDIIIHSSSEQLPNKKGCIEIEEQNCSETKDKLFIPINNLHFQTIWNVILSSFFSKWFVLICPFKLDGHTLFWSETKFVVSEIFIYFLVTKGLSKIQKL